MEFYGSVALLGVCHQSVRRSDQGPTRKRHANALQTDAICYHRAMPQTRYVFAGHPLVVKVEIYSLRHLGSVIEEVSKDRAPSTVAVVSDSTVWPHYGQVVKRSLEGNAWRVMEHVIAPGEASKSWAVAAELFQFFAQQQIGRDAVVVALGGGVVSDLAGFVSATWMRGVRLVLCPTTLEADIDAAIGGKTAINIPGGKNLVGAFHQPKYIVIDPSCLKTLPRRELCAAMAESIKHALISSGDFLEWHEANVEAILALEPSVTMRLIEENIRIKAEIVSRDPNDQTGERAVLNLGHTIGHAIEECCGFTLRHGECVALGLAAACRLSNRLGMLDSTSAERIERLLARFQLPIRLESAIDPDVILSVMRNDKKVRSGSLQFVLLEAIGRPLLRGDVPQQAVREVIESLLA